MILLAIVKFIALTQRIIKNEEYSNLKINVLASLKTFVNIKTFLASN